MNRIKTRHMVFIILLGLFILLAPILLNSLLFSWRIDFANGSLESWMGFISTYYGAIVGGVISGTLTLLGVIYTIKKDGRKDFLAAYPKRRKCVDDIVDELFWTWRTCANFNLVSRTMERQEQLCEYICKREENIERILEKSALVDAKLYEKVRTDYSSMIQFMHADLKDMLDENEEMEKEYIDYCTKVFAECYGVAESTANSITERFNKISQ